MKYFYIVLIILSSLEIIAQKPDSEAILKEGKLLYRLEKASWYATDHFLGNFSSLKDSIGGYLSYQGEDEKVYSIFFGKQDNYQILIRYMFDYNPKTNPISVDTDKLIPNDQESDLISIRQNALNLIYSNEDEFFTFYQNTSLNTIPLIDGKKKKVMVLTAPRNPGVVLLGNDYLLEYNDENELKKKIKLHNSLIDLPGKSSDGKIITATTHSHVLSNHIGSTDICTLLLYKDYVDWKQHYVIHKDYVSILDLEKENLAIMTKKAFEKIGK